MDSKTYEIYDIEIPEELVAQAAAGKEAEVLESMDPFLYGSEMIRKVTVDEATWNDLPHRFESGTPIIAETIGLGAAIDYLNKIGMDVLPRTVRLPA
jgi:selenocysteine lyase/cysteine desulfurase